MKLASMTMMSLLVLSPVTFAVAADGTINFTGSITSSTCKIDGANVAATKTVALGAVPTVALSVAGQTAGDQAFSLALTECNAGTTGVAARFESLDLATVDGYLALTSGTGVAQNVQIGIYGINGELQPINGGVPTDGYVNLENGAATLNYVAAYHATGAAVAGTANSQVSYTLSYQ